MNTYVVSYLLKIYCILSATSEDTEPEMEIKGENTVCKKK